MKIEYSIQSSSKILNRDEAFNQIFDDNLEKEIGNEKKIDIYQDNKLILEIDYSNLEIVEKIFSQTIDNLKKI